MIELDERQLEAVRQELERQVAQLQETLSQIQQTLDRIVQQLERQEEGLHGSPISDNFSYVLLPLEGKSCNGKDLYPSSWLRQVGAKIFLIQSDFFILDNFSKQGKILWYIGVKRERWLRRRTGYVENGRCS